MAALVVERNKTTTPEERAIRQAFRRLKEITVEILLAALVAAVAVVAALQRQEQAQLVHLKLPVMVEMAQPHQFLAVRLLMLAAAVVGLQLPVLVALVAAEQVARQLQTQLLARPILAAVVAAVALVVETAALAVPAS
jgi:hypothetical protein